MKRVEATFETRRVELKRETFICDFCKEETSDQDNWSDENYAIDKTRIKLSHGSSYPDSGWVERIEFHVCPDCFRSEMIPFFESRGIKPTKEEKDW